MTATILACVGTALLAIAVTFLVLAEDPKLANVHKARGSYKDRQR